MITAAEKTTKLTAFTQWVDKHIKGDEKGEAQVFLDRMFQAFGWLGLKEAGAECEERVKNTNGGTSFADLVWKPIVVIEMKKRGTDSANITAKLSPIGQDLFQADRATLYCVILTSIGSMTLRLSSILRLTR